jgi:hypothetical protein
MWKTSIIIHALDILTMLLRLSNRANASLLIIKTLS